MAWTNKVLRVNLSEGTCNSEPLNTKWAQDYIGQDKLVFMQTFLLLCLASVLPRQKLHT